MPELSFPYVRMSDMQLQRGSALMVIREYSKQIDAIIVEKTPTAELPTMEGLRARESSPSCLTFTAEAAALRTPFRDYALQTIFELAREELGNKLKDAVVSMYYDPYEPEPPALALGIAADIEAEEFGTVFRSISNSVFEEKSRWSDAHRKEYAKAIHYDLVPLRI